MSAFCFTASPKIASLESSRTQRLSLEAQCHVKKPQKTLAPADPQQHGQESLGLGGLETPFLGRKMPEPALNWLLSRQCLHLLHYLCFLQGWIRVCLRKMQKAIYCYSSSFFFRQGNKSCGVGLCQWIVTRDNLGPSFLSATLWGRIRYLSLLLRTEISILHICATLKVF